MVSTTVSQLLTTMTQDTSIIITLKPTSRAGSARSPEMSLSRRRRSQKRRPPDLWKLHLMAQLPSSRSVRDAVVGVEDWCRLGTIAITAQGAHSCPFDYSFVEMKVMIMCQLD